MAKYKFKELTPGTYQVKDHTIIKDSNGQWVSTPPMEDVNIRKAFLKFSKTL